MTVSEPSHATSPIRVGWIAHLRDFATISLMDDAITAAFQPLIGLPCWGVTRGQGSILSFEFGLPHLDVREPYSSTSSSAKVRKLAARRRVRPAGEWNLFVFCCHWRVTAFGEPLATDESTHEQIEGAACLLDGQKLTAVAIDADTHTTTFSFDLGSVLTSWPYEAGEEEQWSLYLPGRSVLTYRSDGHYSLGPSDQDPNQEIWHNEPRSIRIS